MDEALVLAQRQEAVLVDARSVRNYDSDPRNARGAVRLSPEDPVRSATEQRLAKHGSLVVYCA